MTDEPTGKPGRPYAGSLAIAFSQIAATWHSERNGSMTPDRVAPKAVFDAWWRCPACHEWQEPVANRSAMPGRSLVRSVVRRRPLPVDGARTANMRRLGRPCRPSCRRQGPGTAGCWPRGPAAAVSRVSAAGSSAAR
ncbi:zinc-ribbon domain-containing protein [Streptomyces sp. NPDC004227]